jgi:hypothetical protein
MEPRWTPGTKAAGERPHRELIEIRVRISVACSYESDASIESLNERELVVTRWRTRKARREDGFLLLVPSLLV